MDPAGFTSAQVARLSGVSLRQLRHWRRTGLLVPAAVTRGGHARYAFSDLVAARAIRRLMDAGIPVRRLRRCVEAIRRHLPELAQPLAALSVVATPDALLVFHAGTAFEAVSGQAWILDIAELERDLRRRLAEAGQAPWQPDLFAAEDSAGSTTEGRTAS